MPRPLEATPPKSLRPDWPCRLLAPPPEVGPTSVSRSVMTPRRKCRDVISPRPQLSSVPSMSSLPAAALPGAMDPEFDDVVAPEDLMVRPRPLPPPSRTPPNPSESFRTPPSPSEPLRSPPSALRPLPNPFRSPPSPSEPLPNPSEPLRVLSDPLRVPSECLPSPSECSPTPSESFRALPSPSDPL